MTPLLALDDEDGQARAGWRIGAALCRACGGYHQAWGMLRAAGVVGGPRVDQAVLPPLLNDLCAPGAHILIAGAADAGLLQLVAEAASARPLSVTVVDRCPAPLALIGEIEPPVGLSITRAQADLTAFETADSYDLILSHSMLYFLPRAEQLGVLKRLGQTLSDVGRLVLVLRLAPPVSNADMALHDDAWLRRAKAKLAQKAGLADYAGEALWPVLERYARARAARLDAFANAGEVEAMLELAGLKVDRHLVSGRSTALKMGETVNVKQSHIFVARRA